MRDPMSWAIQVFRAFGIPVKVHLFFFLVTIGLSLRYMSQLPHVWWVDIVLLNIVVLFGIILVHEFGHCFGARYVDGDAKEVLIWPLGGLAFVDVPHNPRAYFISTAAGPAVNVVICLICAAGMAAAGYLPSLNPLRDPYRAEVYNYREGRAETSPYGINVSRAEAIKKLLTHDPAQPLSKEEFAKALNAAKEDSHLAPVAVIWCYRVFWLSWVLFLFNLIPAYPLDGGRILQSLVWARTDYRRGVVVAAYSGFGVSVLFLLVSIWKNEALFMGLALFMLYEASMALYRLEMDDGPFGYDFSAGYTSLEKEEDVPPRPKKMGWFKRWRQARAARRLHRELEERTRDDERMDQLLEKIARSGKESLTDEERRFLERMSARRRNMS
jgi:stage IV sporulation protein FB